jgi:hypothetical protein
VREVPNRLRAGGAGVNLAGFSSGGFPPEPIRVIGAHLVRTAVVRHERAEIRDHRPSWLAVKLSKLAPAGLKDNP